MKVKLEVVESVVKITDPSGVAVPDKVSTEGYILSLDGTPVCFFGLFAFSATIEVKGVDPTCIPPAAGAS